MKKASLSLVCLLLPLLVMAQSTNDILTTTAYRKGIYMSFQEFRLNSPSIEVEFDLEKRSKSKQLWIGGSDFELEVKDTVIDKSVLRKVWGISTGDSIYVNASNYQLNYGYTKLLALGRYCYLEGNSTVHQSTGGIVGGIAGAIPVGSGFVMNINTGDFFLLTKEVMELILRDDAELSRNYQEEKHRREPAVMFSYLHQFNQRHKDEIIEPESLATRTLKLYRRDKKEVKQPVAVFADGKEIARLQPNSLVELEFSTAVIELCTSDNNCISVTLLPEEDNYVACSFSEKTKSKGPSLEQVKKKVGEFYVKAIAK